MYLWLFTFFYILIKIYLTYKIKVGLKKILVIQFQTFLFTYFYYTKILQILYSTYYKPNESIDAFKMKHKSFFQSIFSCLYKNICHILKQDFKHTYFLV
jgi:hypothetical protein